jgi:zinc protease
MKRHPLLAPLMLGFVLTVSAPLAAWAQMGPSGAPAPSPVAAAPSRAAVYSQTLPNGLTVIVKPDRRAPTAVHMLWVRVGSVDEVDGTSGIAHVLEHMMFKGTATLKPGEFSRRVAALGGRENAFTARDYTGYFQQIPSSRLEEVMTLEADRFANMRWPDDEFRKEIEVVKEERRLRTEDNPRALLYEQLAATAFVASPVRRPIVGWMSDLEAMTADDVRAFHRRWYSPSNAAVVVAGDVDPQAVFELARRHYGPIAARPVEPAKPRVEPPQQGPRRLVLKASAEQAYVALAFKTPHLVRMEAGESQRDALALTLLSAVLDGYPGARLERALAQGADRLADSVGAWHGLMGRGPQQFVLDGVPAPGKTAAQLEAALRAEVARVARDGVSAAELERVRTQWTAGAVYKLDSIMNQARELGSAWALGLPLDSSERLLDQLRTVTPQEVQGVARRYFGDDGLTVAELVPLPPDPNRKPRLAPVGARH